MLRDVIAAGVVVMAAMGNEYEEGNPTEYPAAIPEVCAVGATDELDKRARLLEHRPPHRPRGARRRHPVDHADVRYDGDGEREYDAVGRHVDGHAARRGRGRARAGEVAGLTPAQVIKKLTSSADRVAGAKKGSAAYGAGRLNCEKALR